MTANSIAFTAPVVFPGAMVSVPARGPPAVHVALASFCDLPPSVRAFVIVVRIRDSGGHLLIEVAAVPSAMPVDRMALVETIVRTARGGGRYGDSLRCLKVISNKTSERDGREKSDRLHSPMRASVDVVTR